MWLNGGGYHAEKYQKVFSFPKGLSLSSMICRKLPKIVEEADLQVIIPSNFQTIVRNSVRPLEFFFVLCLFFLNIIIEVFDMPIK